MVQIEHCGTYGPCLLEITAIVQCPSSQVVAEFGVVGQGVEFANLARLKMPVGWVGCTMFCQFGKGALQLEGILDECEFPCGCKCLTMLLLEGICRCCSGFCSCGSIRAGWLGLMTRSKTGHFLCKFLVSRVGLK